MSKSKTKCPYCKGKVGAKKMQKVGALFPFDGALMSYEGSYIEGLIRYPDFYSQWACDDCINDGKALLSKPKKQFYTFKYPWDAANPYLAYYDKSFTCETCKTDFVFSKEEQQHWYEELKFVVYSKPKHCKACRKEIRDAKNLNTELSNLLKDGNPEDASSLERIAEIYEQTGKVEKMRAYLKAANRLKSS